MPRAPRIASLLVAAGLGVGPMLAGCAGGTAPGPAAATAPTSPQPGGIVSDGVHNAQDVAFASDLVVRHRQAIEIAGLAKGRTSTAAVLALADEIVTEQTPEIAEMTRWLAEWGKPVAGPAATVVDGPAVPAPAAELAALRSAKGAAFDHRFLTLTIAGHEASVSQAQDEQRTGADERARGLAEDIAASQSARLTRLRELLAPSRS